jgi:hypothetical protein
MFKRYKNQKAVVLFLVIATIAGAVFALPASALTSSQTQRICQGMSADRTQQCVQRYDEAVKEQCTQTNPTANDACVESIIGAPEPFSSSLNYTCNATNASGNPTFCTGDNKGEHQCGTGNGAESVSINLGCVGEKCVHSATANDPVCNTDINAVVDGAFAIIRFLSIGVGIVVVASVVLAGIQYTSSQGDPAAVAKAMERVRNTVIGLGIYIFIYAILNWLVPAGIFN